MAKEKRSLLPETVETIDQGVFNPKQNSQHSNLIINSRHEFSVIEKKMIYCIINQLDGSMNIQQTDLFSNLYFNIPVSTFGTNYNYQTLRDAVDKITTRNIKGGNDKVEKRWSITPIPVARLENGVVRLMLVSEAVPLFIDLKKHGYTSYELNIALSLSSMYSQRLFELLSRWKDIGKWDVDIDELKHLLAIDGKKAYTKHSNFINIVVEPARAELTEKADIWFTYTCRKTHGRKFDRIEFLIYHRNGNAKVEANYRKDRFLNSSPQEQMSFIHMSLADYKFTKEQQKVILGNKSLLDTFLEVHFQIVAGAIEVKTTSTKYMAGCLRPLGFK